MKIDRFTKIMLMIILLLLAINISTTIRTPLTGTVAYADPAPSFIQVGKIYRDGMGGEGNTYKVIKIGTAGWIYADITEPSRNPYFPSARQFGKKWVNTNQITELTEVTIQ